MIIAAPPDAHVFPLQPKASVAPSLGDRHGRTFEYLRLSLTDLCNFRCGYCLPDGYRKRPAQPLPLTIAEIVRVVRAFAEAGVWKVRLTGGEPTLRTDFAAIAHAVAAVAGIRRVAMTTNGYRLAYNAAAYARAGVSAVNVSVDSLDAATFAQLTGHDRLTEVLAGIDACGAAGIADVKVNAVLLRGVNDGDLDRIADYVATRDVTWRFIELMRTTGNTEYFAAHHVAATALTAGLEARGWVARPRSAGAGPAVDYAHPASRGRIGIIAPYARDFCASCNRLRVSATGKLHLCLFGDGGYDLRLLLQHDDQADALQARIAALIGGKAASHDLHAGNSGATPHFASIGG